MKGLIICCLMMAVGFGSCNWAKEKTKDTLHKGGEIIAKAGSEVADGVRTGIDESFTNLVKLSSALTSNGLTVGRVLVAGTDSTTDNQVSVYIIFEKAFDGVILARVLDKNGLEFGRAKQQVTVAAGDAKFVEFIFDPRTNIDKGDQVILQ